MKYRLSLPLFFVLFAFLGSGNSACGFDIYNQSETQNAISKPDNAPIAAGEFTFRMGYFNFSSNISENNAAVIANQSDLATLNSNFVELFNFDPAQQAEGDTVAYSTAGTRNPNGDVGVPAGGPGRLYAYLLTTDAVWNAPPYDDFIGRQIYVWVQLVSDPSQQAVFTSTTTFAFNPGNDPFNNSTNFIIGDTNPDLNVLVGIDRTATAFDDYQLAGEIAVPGELRLSASTYTVNEGGGSVAVTVQRTGGTDGTVSATFATGPSKPVSAQPNQDYTPVTQTVTFPDGSSADQVVMIPIIEDTVFEGHETFQVMLSTPSGGATLGNPSTATVTIQENDPPPAAGSVSFTATSFSGAEDGGSITITATRAGGATRAVRTGGAISVQYATNNGTAIAGTHYAATSGTLVWADGESGIKSFTVPVIDNTADEQNRTFSVTLSNATGGAVIVAPSTATVTIIDDDVAGTISFTAATASIAENAGSVAVTIQRTGGMDGTVSVNFATANSTPVSAQAGQDYTPVNQTVTFPNGSAAPQVVMVPILDDNALEGNETFQATLTTPAGGATIGMPSTIVITIVDNEVPRPGSFSFSSATYSAPENGGPVTITVVRNDGADGQASVSYRATSGTASAGSDFTATQGTLNFASGQTSATFQITLINDNEIEPDETVNLALSAPTNGATLGAIPDAVLTIVSEDQLPPIDQPDGLVAPRETQAFVGNNVYNTTGDGQIASRNTSGYSTVAFILRVQNDGNTPDSFRLISVASGTAQNASVRYFRNGADITGAITSPSGFALATLPPQGTADFDVQVRFNGATPITGYGATVTITSQRTTNKSDVVRVLGIVNSAGQAPPVTASRADLNVDRKADLMWQHEGTGQRGVWLMDGISSVGERYLPSVPTDWQIVGNGDFNGDSHIDILWQNNVTGERAIWLMNGTDWVGSHFLPTIPIEWDIAGTGDFNNDGKVDILWQNRSNGMRGIWLMDRTNSVGERFLPTIPTEWQIVGTGDFNDDGKIDILWQNNSTGQRGIWLMNGTEWVGEHHLPTIPTEWQIAGTGEFSGDGRIDILWENNSTGQRGIWLMNGTEWVGERFLPTIPTEWRIRNQ